ncbi:MAG TPA: T9SS type A sorting domain-containing protein [Saprospiraceae bacterium]|nr:T9SS type A sorting domain-containing protein [Saprospiraceae bacterium]HPI07237.1 T9SS type A sorting domain-containing protein [Saprospiraceae bacterium]
MSKIITLTVVSILLAFNGIAQTPTSYNQFKVVTEAWQISYHINNTPTNDPVYLVLAPGVYKIQQPITIDRVGAVYIHGLSMAGTLLTDSTNFAGQDLFIVKKTNKFSLAGLTIRTSKPASSDPALWKGAGIRFETNAGNTPHDVEIQEIEQASSFKINAPGTYRVQSSRVPNLGYIINHPDADFVMTQGQCWLYHGNFPLAKTVLTDINGTHTGSFAYPYGLNNPATGAIIHPPLSDVDDLNFMRDSACIIWQKQGRVRIYNTNNVMLSSAYEYRFDSKSSLGPHIIAGLRNETENSSPTLADCASGNRIFKAIAKVSGYGNEIIFKSNSAVIKGGLFHGVCAEKIALVDFQAVDGKAFILGNINKEGYNKMIMNSAGTNLGNADIILLGNKIASLPVYPNMANSTSIPQSMYADIQLGSGNHIENMGNMTRLNNGSPVLVGNDPPSSYDDGAFSDLFLNNVDSLENRVVIPSDFAPSALGLPTFGLSYNALNPNDPSSNHELLWKNILINVRNYGAIPNDGLDDYLAIQTAIDTAVLSNGLLYFPDGQYDISQTLEFNTLTLTGAYRALSPTPWHYGSPTNLLSWSGRSILIAGSDRSTTIINGLGNVLSIFGITNSRMSRMQDLTLIVNDGNIKSIIGVTNSTNPSQAIVSVDPLCTDLPEPGIKSKPVYLWSFRNCDFIGGQLGVATHFNTQRSIMAHNPLTGLNDIQAQFVGTDPNSGNCSSFSGALGECFSVAHCNFQNNTIGFATGWNQAFCHLISDCNFNGNQFGVTQYGAKGSNPTSDYSGYNTIQAGGNFIILNSDFNCTYRDFNSFYQEQGVTDYFNNCNFSAPTAIHYQSSETSRTPYHINKQSIGFVENCNFLFDHTQDALIKDQPFSPTTASINNYAQRFTFFIGYRNSLFCLNSNLSKTTFVKGNNIAAGTFGTVNGAAYLQGVGYGLIAQCTMPGNGVSSHLQYGTKVLSGFNFDPNDANIPQNNPPYPLGYGLTPPVNLYTPRYIPKEIVNLDLSQFSSTNDYYFWRSSINLKTLANSPIPNTYSPSLIRDYALPMQRILLYNAGNQTPTAVNDIHALKDIELTLFPNPVQNVLNVKIESEHIESGYLKVYDMLGKTLYQLKIAISKDANSFMIDLSDFNSGILVISLQTQQGVISKKIFKQ